MDLEIDQLNDYYLAVTALEAQEMLVAMEIADFPHGKRHSREMAVKRIRHMAFTHNTVKLSPVEDAVRALQRLQNGRR